MSSLCHCGVLASLSSTVHLLIKVFMFTEQHVTCYHFYRYSGNICMCGRLDRNRIHEVSSEFLYVFKLVDLWLLCRKHNL